MAEIRGGDDMVSSESFRVRSPGMGSMAELLRDRRSRELAFSRLGGPFPLPEVEGASASSGKDKSRFQLQLLSSDMPSQTTQ
jgi:hypothetical protein